MFRLMYLTFYAASRVTAEKEAHIHESPRVMTVPLTVLALGSVFAGWLGTPKLWHLGEGFRTFENWLAPAFATAKSVEHPASTEWILMGLSVAVALAGIGVARYFYSIRTDIPDRIAQAWRPLYTVLYNKWYVDELFDFLFVNGLGKGGGQVCSAFDRDVVDGGVNGAGWLTRAIATISNWWDKWIIDGLLVNGPAIVTRLVSYPVRLVQWGLVQWYALVMVAGVVGFVIYYVAR
jgi:NADH-quinone oxidoreductase subunit L